MNENWSTIWFVQISAMWCVSCMYCLLLSVILWAHATYSFRGFELIFMHVDGFSNHWGCNMVLNACDDWTGDKGLHPWITLGCEIWGYLCSCRRCCNAEPCSFCQGLLRVVSLLFIIFGEANLKFTLRCFNAKSHSCPFLLLLVMLCGAYIALL